MRIFSRFIAIAGLALFGLSQQASAAVLYDNSPFYVGSAYAIYGSYRVADSFTLSSTSTVTGVTFESWINGPTSDFLSVNWSIVPTAPDWVVTGTTATVTSVFSASISPYNFNYSSFSTGAIVLAAGTYYLQLDNAVATSPYSVLWGTNYGPSTAYLYGLSTPSYPSEYFQILGDAGAATPLPSTWLMMISGFVGLGFLAYRGTKKNAAALAAA